jgi:hypothetical protein
VVKRLILGFSRTALRPRRNVASSTSLSVPHAIGQNMLADELTLGQEIILWIETTCRVPEGALIGRPIQLRHFGYRVRD